MACDAVHITDIFNAWLEAYVCFGYRTERNTELQLPQRLDNIKFTLSNDAAMFSNFVLVEPTLRSWDVVYGLLLDSKGKNKIADGINDAHLSYHCTN